jgi:predicted RNase H-like nuclease (RuvC/YqgF family)
VDLKQL